MQRSIFASIFTLLLSSCTTTAPIQTATSQPALIEETPTLTSVPSTAAVTPTPETTATPTWRPTPTPVPVKTYYDAEFGISVSYPEEWEMVAPRHFEGEDGFLTIKELEGYSTYSIWYVCNDYVFTRGYPNGLVPYGPVCVNVLPDDADSYVFIYKYAVSESGSAYLVLETSRDYFMLIASSLQRDDTRNIYLSKHTISPAPIEGTLFPNIYISERYVGAASYNWSRWNLALREVNFADSNREWRQTETEMSIFCGKEAHADNGIYTAEMNANEVQIELDEKVIFSTVPPFRDKYLDTFCVWDGHWYLENSGHLLRDGEIVNHILGYEDIDTWSVLSGKVFYFFVKDGKTWISLDGKTLWVSYDYVWRDGCCFFGVSTNPKVSNDTIWFYAVRDGGWYSVELKVTD